MSRPPRRRLRRLFGRLTAATLGAASLAATPVDDPPSLSAPAGDSASDDGDPRQLAAAHWLAVSLERMTPLDATHLACRWALSTDPAQRLTVASALEWTFPLLGDGSIIDHLSRDQAPDVRAAAARAAWVRHAIVGDEVLARLAGDPAPEVREVALLASRGR